jgi:uncharacterized membrane protein YhhN
MKSLGYLISTLSVLMLGAVAWPKPGEPSHIKWLVIGGMASSVVGMFLRYLSHRKDKKDIAEAKLERGA